MSAASCSLFTYAAAPLAAAPRRQVAGVVGRAQDDDDVGVGGHDPAGGLDAVHLRHVDVHQHQGRVQPVDQLDRLGTARRLAGELETLAAGAARPGPPSGTAPGRRRRAPNARAEPAKAASPDQPRMGRRRSRGCVPSAGGVWPASRPAVSSPAPACWLRYTSTALTRRLTSFSSDRPSLAKIELVCFSTARSVTNSVAAIAALLLPWAISARISDSRAVSDDRPGLCSLRARLHQLVHHRAGRSPSRLARRCGWPGPARRRWLPAP